MTFAEEKGNYKGWSIEAIQEYKMGVEPKTAIFNDYLENFHWQWTTKIMMMQKHFIKN